MRRPSLAAAVTAFVVVGAVLFILLQLQPGLLIAHTTPAGGDMGAHVWAPAYLRDHLLPHGRLTGWAPDWYDGFPALHYYFPLPSLVIVGLDLFLPYGVAFKIVTVSGLLALPVAAAYLGRGLRLPFPTSALFACATVPFVFDRYHTIWGGNAAATLAGEFAFSMSLATALFFLGALARALDTGKGRALAAALFAITALCHLLPAAFAVVGALLLIILRRPDRARWGIGVTVGVVGAGLAAFWFVPFIARLPYSNDMGWERTFDYVKNLLPFLRHDDGAAAAMTVHLKAIFPMAAAGAILGLARRRRGAVVLVLLTAAMGLGFRFVPEGPIWNARLLPFWYLGVYLLAAMALAEASLIAASLFRRDAASASAGDGDGDGDGVPSEEPAGDRATIARSAREGPIPSIVALAGLLGVVVLTGVPLGIFATGRIAMPGGRSLPFPKVPTGDQSFVTGWAKWNYSGYERKPDYPEYREAVTTMAKIGKSNGCGRAMWEYEPELNRYGTPMALMLLPYFTQGCIGSMEGLFFESSATVPYHFLNQSELSRVASRAMRGLPYRDLDVAKGVEHLQLLGVRYYMALSPEAQQQAAGNPALRLIATTSSYPVTYGTETKQRSWQIFEVAGSALVAPLAYDPIVVKSGVDSKKGWLRASVDWYQEPSRWDIPLAASGPASWPRVPRATAAVPAVATREAKITRIRSGDDFIRFDVDRPGTPVIVRASYFPNWKVVGARGPYRITPNLMVVVPTSRHVRLHYGWTGIDVGGWLLTLLAVVALLLMLRWRTVTLPEPGPRRTRRARRGAAQSPTAPSVDVADGQGALDGDLGDNPALVPAVVATGIPSVTAAPFSGGDRDLTGQ